MSASTGVVHFWELPREKTYIKLDDSYKKEIFGKAKSLSGTWVGLGRKLNLHINENSYSCGILRGILRGGNNIRLDILLRLSDYLVLNGLENYEKKSTEKHIVAITTKHSPKGYGGILNPKLPFNFNEKEGGIIIAAFLHDGGIDNRFLPNYRSEVSYKLRKQVKDAAASILGDIRIKISEPKNRMQIYFPKIVGLILTSGLGMKHGRKVLTNPGIPKFIFNTKEETRAAFIAQAFDDDGYVRGSLKQKNISLKLSIDLSHVMRSKRNAILKESSIEYAPRLLLDNMKLLGTLGIETTKPICTEEYFGVQNEKRMYRYKWNIDIFGKRNIQTFAEKIKLTLGYKRERLNKIANGFVQDQYGRNMSDAAFIRMCKDIQAKKGRIIPRYLVERSNRSMPRIKQIIRKFRRNGILLLNKPSSGNSCAVYELNPDILNKSLK
jgi:hypothetical protein